MSESDMDRRALRVKLGTVLPTINPFVTIALFYELNWVKTKWSYFLCSLIQIQKINALTSIWYDVIKKY